MLYTMQAHEFIAAALVELRESGIGGRSPSLKWPHLYDILRGKGYSKEKSARISNAKRFQRKPYTRIKGISPEAVKKFNKTHP